MQRDRAAVERLRRELASLQGEQLAMQEELTRLDLEIELRTIRAPVAGRIAKLNTLHKGAVIAHGAQIAVIVPPGPLHVVAEFPAGAVGLIKHGQLAEVRFASFPWMEFGSLQAHVERVGSEPGIEGVRVELAITPEQFHHIPLQHGLVGTVAIRVDEVTPLQFLLRSLGGSIKHGTDSATPQP